MKNLKTFDEFLNESILNEANDTLGPKFVEEFLTNKRESFGDRFAFYGWVRKVLPTVYLRETISYNSARSLSEKAEKKYPEYKMSVVGGDKPDECQVWCNVMKVSDRREVIYDVLLGHATSMSDIDSMINNFESTIKKLDK